MNFPGAEHSFVSGSAAHRPIRVEYRARVLGGDGWPEEPSAPLRNLLTGSLRSVLALSDDENPACASRLLLAEITFTELCQGPPGHAHGGSTAAALDELMGGAGWINLHPVLARHIDVDFLAPVPIGTLLFGVGALLRKDGRKIHARAALCSGEGVPLARSRGLFIELSDEQMQSFKVELHERDSGRSA